MASTPTSHALQQDAVQPSFQVQADFYSKLAKLVKSVLAQQHPRFKLPQAEVERLARALNNATSSTPAQQKFGAVTNGVTAHRPENPAPKPPVSSSVPSHNAPTSQKLTADKGARTKTTASSTIDPVLLTKSDGLINAEINLKRIREIDPERIHIEKSLKQAVNNSKRGVAKDQEFTSWLGPVTFDVAQVLEKAKFNFESHPDLKALPTNDNTSVNSSSDEFSYYSSQVNTRSPGEKEAGLNGGHPVAGRHGIDDAPPPLKLVGDLNIQPVAVREPRISGLGPRDIIGVGHGADKPPHSNLQPADVTDSSQNTPSYMKDVEDIREESYSPPGIPHAEEPQPPPQPPHHSTQYLPAQSFTPRHQTKRKPHEGIRTRESESYSPPPPPQIPVITNHLEAPLAPQPSRVSPIALGDLSHSIQIEGNTRKGPKENQTKKKTRGPKAKAAKKTPNTSDFTPKSAPGQQITADSRKRRRETDNDDDFRRNSGQQAFGFPQPAMYIKQEAVSPAQLGGMFGVEAPRRLVLRDDGRTDIEVLTPRYTQGSRPLEEPYSRLNDGTLRLASQRSLRYSNQEPIVIDESDNASPATRRRSTRDEGDLRRLASFQYGSRPYSPVQHTSPRSLEDQQHSRPVSRTMMNRSMARPYPYYEESAMHAPTPRRFQERRLNPIFVGDEYLDTQPAPKRRIVVDQYGNEYIAVPARPTVNHPIARELPDYGGPASPYVRQAAHGQNIQGEHRFAEHRQSARQQPQIIELDDEEEDYQRMPPPQLVPHRRPTEARDDRLTQPLYYQQAHRSVSLQPQPPLNDTRYQIMPDQVPMWDRGEGTPSGRERAYSARPDTAQQGLVYPRL